MVAGLDRRDAGPDLPHDPCALMVEDRGEDALTVDAAERIGVGMADAGCHDLYQHLAALRPSQVEFDDFEGLFGFKSDSGTGFSSCLQTLCGAGCGALTACFDNSAAILR